MAKEDIEKAKIFEEYSEHKSQKAKEQLSYANRFAESAKKSLEGFLQGMGEEYDETVSMAKFFYKYLERKLNLKERETPPSKEEVREAIEQLKDMGRIGVFASVSILPGGGLSLLGLEILARKMGITSFSFIPSSFRKRLYKKYGYKKNNSESEENKNNSKNKLDTSD